MKKSFFALCLAALPLLTMAQDKIYKTDGSTLEAKVKNVGPRIVVYVRYDNQSGPEYSIPKRDIEKIVYQNGSEEYMNDRRTPHADGKSGGNGKVLYRPNVLALAPVQFSEHGLGVAVSYERSLDPRGIVALYLPVIATFNLNNGTYYDPMTGSYKNGRQDMMVHILPGIKVYPTGNQGVVRYAIGPSVAFATGEKSDNVFDPSTGMTVYTTKPHTMLGMMVNNSLNINPSPHVYIGLEIGLGFTYINRVDGLNQDTNGLAQGGFKIGYRF